LPGPGELPSPWETWTLIGLVRHRKRQLWVAEVIRTRRGGSLTDLAHLGALGRPQRSQSGTVPGLPEWECYFHDKGCCLTHKVTGEDIDVYFWDDSAEYFDTFFYEQYLKSLRQPDPAEGRLRELRRSIRPVKLSVADLIRAGMLTPLPGRESYPYRVPDQVLGRADTIEPFCASWEDVRLRPWLAALVGDWPAVQDTATGPGRLPGVAVSEEQAGQCRELRRRRLLRGLGDKQEASDALWGLADLGPSYVAPVLADALQGPPSGTTSAALEIIEQLDDPGWCPQVHSLFRRVQPGGQYPPPHFWMKSLKFLVRHGYQREELLAALPSAAGAEIGEACLLALEHAPELALPLFRRALLSNAPANRTTVAATLVLIDKPWSRRVLLGALECSDEQERTADARVALLESREEEARRAVLAWEQRNPHEPEAGSYLEIGGRTLGPFYSIGELALRDRAARVHYEMEKLHDRVMKVRDRIPPEPQ
jgi:hypothetical protein